MPPEKPLLWLEGEVKTPPFSREARIEAGVLLGRLQQGDAPEYPHARPMPIIGPRCLELRVKDRNAEWRIMVHLAPDAVVILDVFAKKSERTPHAVISNCRRRLAAFRMADTQE